MREETESTRGVQTFVPFVMGRPHFIAWNASLSWSGESEWNPAISAPRR